MATFNYPTPTASYNGGQPSVGRDVRDDLDEVRTFIVGKNLEGSNIQDDTIEEDHLVAAVLERLFSPGMMIPFAGTSVLSGWLFCDGSAVSTTTFSALFAIIGFTYNGDPGGGNFNLPDLRGRYPRGSNESGLPNGTNGSFTRSPDVGDEFGIEVNTISITDMPSHDHPVGSHVHPLVSSHNHSSASIDFAAAFAIRSDISGGGTMLALLGTDIPGPNPFVTGLAGVGNTGASSGDTGLTGGGGTDFNVMDPQVTVNYLIKT